MDNKKLLIVGGVGFGAYLIYKSLRLRQAALNIHTDIKNVSFDFYRKSSNLTVTPQLVISNPIGATIQLSNIFGTLTDDKNNTLGYFQTGPVVVGSGNTYVNIPIIISGLNTFLALSDAISTNKWPKLYINYTMSLIGGIFPIKDQVVIDTGSLPRAIKQL